MSNPNTAAYPSALATDSTLPPASDLYSATLTSAITSGSTSIPVSSLPQNFPAIISIDNEEILIGSNTSNSLNVTTRGFNGTAAASHAQSASVFGNLVSHHINQLAAEVKAVETALGTGFAGAGINSSISTLQSQMTTANTNITTNATNITTANTNIAANTASIVTINTTLGRNVANELVNTFFDFTPQAPGGSLTGGITNTVTLTPVPLGVNGADVGHYLYVSNGTGTAEPVLITGGTAVSGSGSGTITFVPVNNHSGAWTIQSATAGIYEAAKYGGATCKVKISAGSFSVYGPLILTSVNNFSLQGCGQGVTTLNMQTANLDIIQLNSCQAITISEFALNGKSTSASGYGINCTTVSNSQFFNLSISTVVTGIHLNHAITNLFDNITINIILSGSGFLVEGADTQDSVIRNCTTIYAHAYLAGCKILECSQLSIIGCNFLRGQYGIVVTPGNGQAIFSLDIDNTYMDNNTSNGLNCTPVGTGVIVRVRVMNSWTTSSTSHGVILESGTTGVSFTNCIIALSGGNGILIQPGASDIDIVNCKLINATGGTGIVLTTCDKIRIQGNLIGNALWAFGAGTMLYGIFINAASTNVFVQGNFFSALGTSPVSVGFVASTGQLKDNYGYNPVGISAITVGASPFTYTAGPSSEMIYITGGTVSLIKRGATTVAAASPAQALLPPGGTLQVTYTVAPTMIKDIQ